MTAEIDQTAEDGADPQPRRSRRTRAAPVRQAASTRGSGGRYAPLGAADMAAIHGAALEILGQTGLSEAPESVRHLVLDAGGRLSGDGRLLFPAPLVERALAGLRRDVVLHGQREGLALPLSGKRVHVGSGGAAPMVIDLDTGLYRPSTLRDLHEAARLVDAMENVHFFSRSLVARDMPDDLSLDVNTAFASLAGTAKPVMVAAQDAAGVRAIAEMCHLIAGSEAAFRAAPFLSLNINHVTPPLRFAAEAMEVLIEAVRVGLPVHVNTFGQLGASSPVTIAGCLAQTVAETLAGIVCAWLASPDVAAIFGARPMVTDLRTGGMAGGAGEQALLTAASVQMAQFYGLANSTIAGATDSKIADAQSGYEKCLSVTLAAQAGANLITQACGMQAGLMGASLESYVIDNEMLGAILRSLTPIEVSPATLSPAMIGEVARGEGHFLGRAETLSRMETDFLYPRIADRRSPEAWAEDGAPDIRVAAQARARALRETHFPGHMHPEAEAAIRARFDIRLPEEAMKPR